MADELARWKQQQAQDKIRAGDKYTDYGFIAVTNEFGHYFEQKTFKDYYDRLLKDADIGHFTFHAPDIILPPVRWSAAWTTRPCQPSSVITP